MNQIILTPTKNKSIFDVFLNLPFEKRWLGKIDTTNKSFITTRKPQHLFKKLNAIGLNLELLKDTAIPFKDIVIEYESQKLITSRDYFLTHGKCFKFGSRGFEYQKFLPLSEFGLSKVEEYESRQCVQQSLFPVM